MDIANLLMLLVTQCLTAGAVYGGIRADLRNLTHRAEAAEQRANDAHQRIDQLLQIKAT